MPTRRSLRPDVTFMVAGSGLGKSVACYRRLQKHVESGAWESFFPTRRSFQRRLSTGCFNYLRQHHQNLIAVGSSVLSFGTAERPLLLMVEDINRSGQAQLLVEKLAGWSRTTKDSNGSVQNWRLVCPLWPEIISSMGDETRKRIEPLTITSGGFTAKEACDAVLARAQIAGRNFSALHAEMISSALGHDPLLIALHDLSKAPDPYCVINVFIEGSISRAALAAKDYPAAEFRRALRALAGEMLARRQTELFWRNVSRWEKLQGAPLQMISRLAHHGELIRFTGPSTDQRLSFRHDRVRECLLADSAGFLRQPNLGEAVRIGALRLAGHLAASSLASAIEACWIADDNRDDHLDDYLWAFGQCCMDDFERFLGPVCDAWAALPDESEKKNWPSPRDSLAAHHLRWAFRRWPPVHAIDYFIHRGSDESLRWPITYMLHGMDHPKAVLFVAQELAAIQRRLAGTNSFSSFAASAGDDWRRGQEDGRPMSKSSRNLLLGLWRDETKDKYIRLESFRLWAVTQQGDDIQVLCAAPASDELAAHILGARLVRGDQLAVPAMIEKLKTGEHGHWWQYGRHVWSTELTKALDEFLLGRSARSKGNWGESFESDWSTHEMIMRLPESEAEQILLKHWPGLRFGAHFIQTALYVSTPPLLLAVEAAVKECLEPAKLMVHVGQHFGIRTRGHPGLTRESQVRALAPYLNLLSPLDVAELWGACNDHGWFRMRREVLDAWLQPPYLDRLWNKNQVVLQLDKMTAERHIVLIDYWIDGYLKVGVHWSEIVATMMTWLDERRSLEALRIVARAIDYRGTRGDLVALKAYDGMPQARAQQLIKDTHFAVRRRSIC